MQGRHSSVSGRLHQAAAPIWEACLHHPFVTGIGDGSLAVEKFRHFMLQDYLYLFDYARVFALGVVKAQDHELMRTFARNVEAILGGEMNIHRAYMERLGITEEQVLSTKPALDNLSYTHYMLSVAYAGGPMDIVAAILACSWSYAEIGQALAALPGAAGHPFYGEWIRGYASDEYAATNQALIELMDKLAADVTPEQLVRLTEIFVTCSRYELGFWDMAWEVRV
nr:thiaminase II [bacterium]